MSRRHSLDRRCRTPSPFRTPPDVRRDFSGSDHPVQRELVGGRGHNREWSIASWCPPRSETPSPARRNWNSPIYGRRVRGGTPPRSPSPNSRRRQGRLQRPQRVGDGSGLVFDDPKEFGEPEFKDSLREIAIHVIASAVGDFSLVLKMSLLPQFHDIPEFRETMCRAATYAREPDRHSVGLGMLRSHTNITRRIYNENCNNAFDYQDQLEDHLKKFVVSDTMIRSTKWRAFTSAFHIVRNSALLVRYCGRPCEYKMTFYTAIADACAWSVCNPERVEKLLGSWKCYAI